MTRPSIRSDIKCFKCGQVGHYARECTVRSACEHELDGEQREGGRIVTCYFCRRPGHLSAVCPETSKNGFYLDRNQSGKRERGGRKESRLTPRLAQVTPVVVQPSELFYPCLTLKSSQIRTAAYQVGLIRETRNDVEWDAVRSWCSDETWEAVSPSTVEYGFKEPEVVPRQPNNVPVSTLFLALEEVLALWEGVDFLLESSVITDMPVTAIVLVSKSVRLDLENSQSSYKTARTVINGVIEDTVGTKDITDNISVLDLIKSVEYDMEAKITGIKDACFQKISCSQAADRKCFEYFGNQFGKEFGN